MPAEKITGLSPLKAARRDKILIAAEHLFERTGFRATTMEGVAEAAGMSKVTVYGYFKDKDALFTAVAERFALRIDNAFSEALNRSGTLPAKLSQALVAKHVIVFDVLHNSPFSDELFEAKNRVVAALIDELDRSLIAKIAACLHESGYTSDNAPHIAHLIFSACHGVAEHTQDLESATRDIEILVTAIVAKTSTPK